MSGAVDVVNPQRPKRALVVASNPAVLGQTGWPIGLWWAELAHPADGVVGRRVQPLASRTRPAGLPGPNFVVWGWCKAHAVRDGNLITGQQQYSGAAAARLVIHTLGV